MLANDNLQVAQPRSEDNNVLPTTESEETVELEGGYHNDALDMQVSSNDVAGQQEDAGHDTDNWEPNADVGIGDWHEEIVEEFNGNWQESMDQNWPPATAAYDVGGDSHLPEVHEEWHEDEPPDAAENWQDEQADPPIIRTSSPMRSVNRFYPLDDENVHSMELRELHSRYDFCNMVLVRINYCLIGFFCDLQEECF